MGMRVMKRYNQNANHKLKYKYHKTLGPTQTLDRFVKKPVQDDRDSSDDENENFVGLSGQQIGNGGVLVKDQKLIESDVKNIGIDTLLKLWIAQFMENALDADAENIEIRFFRKGLNGFDFIYDGEGISDQELP